MPGGVERLPTTKELNVFSRCPLLCAFVIPSFPQRGTEEFGEWIREVNVKAQKIKSNWTSVHGEASFDNTLSVILCLAEEQKLFHRTIGRSEREGVVTTLLLIGYEIGTMKDLSIVKDSVLKRLVEDMEYIAPSLNTGVVALRCGAFKGIMNAGVYCKQRLETLNLPTQPEELLRTLMGVDEVWQETFTKPLTPSNN